ncbi:MAG: nucleotidyltransferase family protein [Gemmatimonadales bacterium]|nr:nucleotidyltransferase family protein [Gemmatimonadales bacterium]
MIPDAALVLAAGKSTRIAARAQGRPKPLLDFAGEPLIGWNLRWLATSGVARAWVNLHHRFAEVMDAVGDGSRWQIPVTYSFEPEILGTAGAWRRLAAHWGARSLVVYGDNVSRFSLAALAGAHAAAPAGTLATIALFDPARHLNTGIAGGRVLCGADGRVAGFTEGGAGADGLVNAGVYVLEHALLARLPDGFLDFGRDVFPALAAEGRLHGHVLEPGGFCLGLDTPESFAAGEALLHDHRLVLT